MQELIFFFVSFVADLYKQLFYFYLFMFLSIVTYRERDVKFRNINRLCKQEHEFRTKRQRVVFGNMKTKFDLKNLLQVDAVSTCFLWIFEYILITRLHTYLSNYICWTQIEVRSLIDTRSSSRRPLHKSTYKSDVPFSNRRPKFWYSNRRSIWLHVLAKRCPINFSRL